MTVKNYDVCVIGLGAMGMATVDACAARGLKVIGLEQFDWGHDRGSSHGKSRIIRKAYFEGAFYVPLLERAYELWRNLEADSGQQILHLCGGLFSGSADGELVQNTRAATEAYGVKTELLSRDESLKRFPQFHIPENHVTVFEPAAGYISPETVFGLLRQRAQENGAVLKSGAGATRIERAGPNRFRVPHEDQEVEASQIVLTPGPWAAQALQDLGWRLAMQVERLSLHWFDPGRAHERFAGPSAPVGVWEAGKDELFYGFPLVVGDKGLKFGFHTGHRRSVTPDTVDRQVAPEEIEAATQAIRRLIPDAELAHVAAKTCLYSTTPDHNFILGSVPEMDGLYIAGGFSGHGYKFSLLVGEVMSRMALGENAEYDLSAFSPRRVLTRL